MVKVRGSLSRHFSDNCIRRDGAIPTTFSFEDEMVTFINQEQTFNFISTEVENVGIHKHPSNSNSISIELFVNHENNHFHIFLNYDFSSKTILEDFYNIELPWSAEINENRLKLLFHMIWISGLTTFLLINFLVLQIKFSSEELMRNPQYSIFAIVISIVVSSVFYFLYNIERTSQRSIKSNLISSS